MSGNFTAEPAETCGVRRVYVVVQKILIDLGQELSISFLAQLFLSSNAFVNIRQVIFIRVQFIIRNNAKN